MRKATDALAAYFERIPFWRLGVRCRGRLTKAVDACLVLPECSVREWGQRHLMIQVRKRTFAYFLLDHHDDGIVALCMKSTLEKQRSLVRQDPDRFCVPAYLGPSGWVSMRLDRRGFDRELARNMLREAYLLAAPAKLARVVRSSASEPGSARA